MKVVVSHDIKLQKTELNTRTEIGTSWELGSKIIVFVTCPRESRIHCDPENKIRGGRFCLK